MVFTEVSKKHCFSEMQLNDLLELLLQRPHLPSPTSGSSPLCHRACLCTYENNPAMALLLSTKYLGVGLAVGLY